MTTSQFSYGTISTDTEATQLRDIISQCFMADSEYWHIYRDRIGIENFRIIRKHDRVVGGLALLPMQQWFGSQPVSMGGIAAVGIAPEYRGSGAAIVLLQGILKELHNQDIATSTLYSAAQPLYRKAGYEQAGIYCNWEIAISTLQLNNSKVSLAEINHLPMQSLLLTDTDTLPLLERLYTQQAQSINGFLVRHPAIWQQIIRPEEDRGKVTYAYLIGTIQKPQGYIIFSQKRTDKEASLQIHDWVLLTNASIKRFWKFILDHRSQIDYMRWKHTIAEDLTLVLAEQTAKIYRCERWMLRVLNIIKALTERGYRQNIEAELHLEIFDDSWFPENNDRFILQVADGRGEVRRGGRGELRIDICSLAPLYTGLFSAYQLQLTRQLVASTDVALHTAAQIFSGSLPWRADFF